MGDEGQARLYRRRVAFGCDGETAWGDLEDDEHRFSATISYADGGVTRVDGEGLRTPWTTCALASQVLKDLQGTPLQRSPFAVLGRLDTHAHCTHMLDAAALAISAAARNVAHRVYDISGRLDRQAPGDRREGRLSRDGRLIAEWRVRDWIMEAPATCTGFDLRRVWPWLDAHPDREDDIEALFVLRRGVLVAGGLRLDLDTLRSAADLPAMTGACFTFQAERAPTALRNHGAHRDFKHRREALLSDPLARSRPNGRRPPNRP